jgi:hypothetical protein
MIEKKDSIGLKMIKPEIITSQSKFEFGSYDWKCYQDRIERIEKIYGR